MIQYLFDVDGTLTNPTEPINPDFDKFFGNWVRECKDKGDEVYIVTGSDRQKTIKQIGLPLYRLVNGVFQNCGNQMFVRNSLMYQSKWSISAHLRLDLLILAERSPWFAKAKKNIEERIGMANFSTIGRTATKEQRKAYKQWDDAVGERKQNSEWLSLRYPKLDFVIGGDISTDIYPKGKDKAQALKYMQGKTIFFGDKCDRGGNDHSIAVSSDKYHQVSGWKETMYIINVYYKDLK